jgi:hypothetical protein
MLIALLLASVCGCSSTYGEWCSEDSECDAGLTCERFSTDYGQETQICTSTCVHDDDCPGIGVSRGSCQSSGFCVPGTDAQ